MNALRDDRAASGVMRWAYGLRSSEHYLTRRVQRGRRVTDTCFCGDVSTGITDPIRAHWVAILGHVVEYVRVGPDTLPEDPNADAIAVRCMCGWTAVQLPDLVTARELHRTHADYPDVLVADAAATY